MSQASYHCGNFSDTQILLLNSYCEIVLEDFKTILQLSQASYPVVIFLTPKFFY